MARPTFVMPVLPRVGVCLWESLVLISSETVCQCGADHTGLVREERASDGGTHP
jgi:hypothetical protein